MTTQGNGHPFRYAIHMSQQTKDVLKHLHRLALENGEGADFLSAFQQIIDRLRNDPLVFGEPLYRLSALKLLIRQGGILPLFVDFAVHEE